MRTIKCPVCKGNNEYKVIQTWESKEYEVPIKCNCDNGIITWSEYCTMYHNKSTKSNKGVDTMTNNKSP